MLRTTLVAGAGASGAAVSNMPATDPMTQRMMMELVRNTPLDPTALTYAQEGMNPMWAFVTIVTMGMGPHAAAAARRWMEDRSADKSRILEATLSGRVERGADVIELPAEEEVKA